VSKLFYKMLIEDCENAKCTTAEQNQLMVVYERTVKRMPTTLARKAWFELADFSGAKEQGIDGFNLMIERTIHNGVEQWVGNFRNDQKNLKIISTLKK
jgi:hypothetical protein